MQYKCYINSCQCRVNSNFAFWNFPPKYFWLLVHWLHRCRTRDCGGLTICGTRCSLSHPLMDIWVVSTSWPLGTGLIWIFATNTCFHFLFFGGYTQECNCWVIWLLWPMTYNYEPPAAQETWVWSLGRENTPGGVHGNPLQYSCLENSHGQRSLVGYSPWVAKSQTQLSD